MNKWWQGLSAKEKRPFFVGLLILIGFIVVVLIAVFFGTTKSEPQIPQDMGVGIEEATVMFENRYQITRLYGSSGSAEVLRQIEEVVLNEALGVDEETLQAGEVSLADQMPVDTKTSGSDLNVIATINETSVKKYSELPLVYVFEMTVSNGREYEIYSRRDEECDAEAEICQPVISTVIIRNGLKTLKTEAKNENLVNVVENWFKDF